MAESSRIIGLTQWLRTPAGRYLLTWEQHHLDLAVADLFGFHALQVGLPELDALRANRMPHRWVAADAPAPADSGDSEEAGHVPRAAVALQLRLRRLAIRQPEPGPGGAAAHAGAGPRPAPDAARGRAGAGAGGPRRRRRLQPGQPVGSAPAPGPHARVRSGGDASLFLPSAGEFLGYRRLRDWLRLLSFEVEAGRFGCYRPPVAVGEVAGALRVDGPVRRALVAGVRRGLLRRRRQAGARHAPGRAGARPARAAQGRAGGR